MGTTLLLADDSITIQKVVGIIFANEDYELVVVDNGDSALEKARETRPDVMLVDALMPGKNGYEVCEEVRRDPNLKDTPLLLLVGAFEPFDEEKARKSGADDHITKPFESQSLIDKVKALVALASARAVAAPAVPEEPSASESVMLGDIPAAELSLGTVAEAAVSEVVPEPEPVAFAEIASSEVSEAEDADVIGEEPLAEAPATEAKLFDSFRDFVHLAGGAAEAAEPVTSAEDTSSAEPAIQEEPEGIVILSTVDIVEASPEDDPWGTFSEVVEEGEPIQFGEVLEAADEETLESSEAVEEIEPFALLDEESTGGAIHLELSQEEPGAADSIASVAEEDFSFEELPEPEQPVEELSSHVSTGGESISLGDFSPVHRIEAAPEPTPEMPMQEETASVFPMTDEPSEPAELSVAEADLPFADEEEYLAADQVLATHEESEMPLASSAASDAVTLTEEQLAAAISRLSRELIEKIAWEVVPDLAETIIKEEIRKIKEGLER